MSEEPRPLNYIEQLGLEVFREVGGSDEPTELPEGQELLFTLYGALVLSKGINTTNRDVHDAWAVWQATTEPHHRSLIPFSELSQETQDLDSPYTSAIRQVARDLMPEHDATLDIVRDGTNPLWFVIRADEASPVFDDAPDGEESVDAIVMDHLAMKMHGWGVEVMQVSTRETIIVAEDPDGTDPDETDPTPPGQIQAIVDDLDETNRRLSALEERVSNVEGRADGLTEQLADRTDLVGKLHAALTRAESRAR